MNFNYPEVFRLRDQVKSLMREIDWLESHIRSNRNQAQIDQRRIRAFKEEIDEYLFVHQNPEWLYQNTKHSVLDQRALDYRHDEIRENFRKWESSKIKNQ